MTTLLLCAGDGNRWSGPYPKQEMKIGEEYLIHRTATQVTWPMSQFYVLIKEEDRQRECFEKLKDWLLVAENHGHICATLRSSIPKWSGHVFVLLGDVFYTQWAITELLIPRDKPWFLGSGSEIYGLSFPESWHDKMRVILDKCCGFNIEARLWHIHRVLTGANPHSHWKRQMPGEKEYFHYMPAGDLTQDFDFYHDYVRWNATHQFPKLT